MYYSGLISLIEDIIYGENLLLFLLGAALTIYVYIGVANCCCSLCKEYNKSYWLAWLPIGQSYLFAHVSKTYKIFLFTLVYLFIDIIELFIEVHPLVSIFGAVMNILFIIYNLIVLYRLGNVYGVKKTLFWWGALFTPIIAMYLFLITEQSDKRTGSYLELYSNDTKQVNEESNDIKLSDSE